MSADKQLSQDLQFIIELARDAGKIVLAHYGKVERLTKSHVAATEEAVTEADRASQRFIIDALRRRFPDDGLIGEENDTGSAITFDCPDPNGRVWVIDPIDGTNNFIAGFGAFAVCIGLLNRGVPVLGVVYDVTRDLAYSAAAGMGAWLGSRRLSVLAAPLSASAMIMLTSNLVGPDGKAPAWAQRWVSQNEWKIRIVGSAAIEAANVASGVAQGAITLNGKLWDVVAPAAIVLEAGGVVTNLNGEAIFPFDLRGYQGRKVPFLAATPTSQPGLLAELAGR